jgi:hypothetical protein
VIKNSSEAVALQDKLTLTRDEQAKIIAKSPPTGISTPPDLAEPT